MSKILQHNALLAQILAEIATFRLTIPIATARHGGSVQQRLSAAAPPGRLPYWVGAADKLYSLGVDEPSRLTPINQEPAMSGVTPIRDPKTDSLLTPQNAVLALIDYQPEQYAGVASVRHDELLAHVTKLGRVAMSFELPVVRQCQSNTRRSPPVLSLISLARQLTRKEALDFSIFEFLAALRRLRCHFLLQPV